MSVTHAGIDFGSAITTIIIVEDGEALEATDVEGWFEKRQRVRQLEMAAMAAMVAAAIPDVEVIPLESGRAPAPFPRSRQDQRRKSQCQGMTRAQRHLGAPGCKGGCK